jgi:hypothetical protein
MINFDATTSNTDREGYPLVTAEPMRVCPSCREMIPDDRDWDDDEGKCTICVFYLDCPAEMKP